MFKKFLPLAAVLLLLLAACGGVDRSADVPPLAPPSTATPTATAVPPTNTPIPAPTQTAATEVTISAPTPEPTLPPTDTPTPEPSPTPSPEPDWLASVGRTADGVIFLGNPDAPVTVIDYSDFM